MQSIAAGALDMDIAVKAGEVCQQYGAEALGGDRSSQYRRRIVVDRGDRGSASSTTSPIRPICWP
jgi:hypothetical protein